MGWICFGVLLGVVVCVALAAAVIWLLGDSPTEHVKRESLACPRCDRTMRYRIKLPKKIRCSCGNIMPVPPPGVHARTVDVSCPGCREVVHVSPIHKPSRVRCRCGNMAEIP